MNWKKLAAAAAAGTALLGASPAFAQPPHWAPAYGWHAKQRHHHYKPRPVVVYAPAPIYYYYAPPRPVIYGHIPVSPDLRVSFGMRF